MIGKLEWEWIVAEHKLTCIVYVYIKRRNFHTLIRWITLQNNQELIYHDIIRHYFLYEIYVQYKINYKLKNVNGVEDRLQ